MDVTVKDILQMDLFKNVQVLAGCDGVERKVANVYFMEVPDIYKYIDAYGILLTTLYPIAGDQQAIEQFIPKLVDQQVSGIGIKLGRYIETIPQVMIDQANKYHFPLMILPNDANLSLLSNSILELLLDKKNSTLQFRDEVHSKLMGLLLEGANLVKLVKSLSEIIKVQVILTDKHFNVMTSSFSDDREIALNKPVSHTNDNLQMLKGQLQINIDGQPLLETDAILNPIYASRECLGYIIALPQKGWNDPNLIVALEQASLLSAFLFQKEEAVQQKERNYLDSFIRDVLNQKFQSQLDVIQKAKVFKWDFDFPVVLLSIEIINMDEQGRKELYTEMLDLGEMEQIIAEKLDISRRKCKMINYNNNLVCFISVVFENRIEERLKNVCETIVKFYKRKYKIGIAVSNTVSNIRDLPKAHDQTKLTLKISKMLNKDESFIRRYDELGIYKLIYEIENTTVLQEYVTEKLGALVQDNHKDTDMLDTLSSLIRNNYNLQKTSRELFIHYNTLRYRIDKLKEMGIDMNDGFDLAEIAVAYQIHLLLHVK